MELKEGVILGGLKLEMRKALVEAEKLWKTFGQVLTVTSGLDSTHSAGSLHYYGYALDLRTRYFTTDEAKRVAYELQMKLGDSYNVVLHTTHIHVEYDAILRT